MAVAGFAEAATNINWFPKTRSLRTREEIPVDTGATVTVGYRAFGFGKRHGYVGKPEEGVAVETFASASTRRRERLGVNDKSSLNDGRGKKNTRSAEAVPWMDV